MKTILLLPFKILWFLIKLPFKILGFIFSGASVKSSGLFNSSRADTTMIAMAKEQGGLVRVYDERNMQIFARPGELHGYTSTTVTVKDRCNFLVTYDIKGNRISARNA